MNINELQRLAGVYERINTPTLASTTPRSLNARAVAAQSVRDQNKQNSSNFNSIDTHMISEQEIPLDIVWFDTRSTSQENIGKLDNMTTNNSGLGGGLFYGENYGLPEYVVGANPHTMKNAYMLLTSFAKLYHVDNLNSGPDQYVVIGNAGHGRQAMWPKTISPEVYTKQEADELASKLNLGKSSFDRDQTHWHPQPLSKAMGFVTHGSAAYHGIRNILQDYGIKETMVVEDRVDGNYTLYLNGKEHEISNDLNSLILLGKEELQNEEWFIKDNQTDEVMYTSNDDTAGGVQDYESIKQELDQDEDDDNDDMNDINVGISNEEANIIARKIEMNFGNYFPDGDPIDGAMQEIEKAGYGSWDTVDYSVMEKVANAFKANTGYDYYDYYDQLLTQIQQDNPEDERWQQYHTLSPALNDDINDLKVIAGIQESQDFHSGMKVKLKESVRDHRGMTHNSWESAYREYIMDNMPDTKEEILSLTKQWVQKNHQDLNVFMRHANKMINAWKENEPEKFTEARNTKSGFIKTKSIGKKVKINVGDHAGKTGTIKWVYREPTFSQMVPFIILYGVTDDETGKTVEVKKTHVSKIKDSKIQEGYNWLSSPISDRI